MIEDDAPGCFLAFAGLWLIVCLGLMGGMVYVAVHFIAKWW